MKIQTIDDVVCPKMKGRSSVDVCRGRLVPDVFSSTGDEVLDGVLVCDSCSAQYPVIQGVPVLVDELYDWLEANYQHVIKTIGKVNLHSEIKRFVSDVLGDKMETASQTGAGSNAARLDEDQYMLNHFDDPMAISHSPVFEGILKKYEERNAYTLLKEAVGTSDLSDKKAIDIGCNSGGLTHFLAGNCRFAYGIDLSFKNVFDASRIIKHVPAQKKEYELMATDRKIKRPLNVEKTDNVDFMVASGRNLPFGNQVFGYSVLSNVLDIARNNGDILNEVSRVVEREGRLFLSYVPGMNILDGGKRNLAMKEITIKNALPEFRFYDVHKDVPFILRHTGHHCTVYSNCCMFGEKKV